MPRKVARIATESLIAAIDAAIAGESRSQIAKRANLSAADAEWIRERAGISNLEWQGLLRSRMEMLQDKMIQVISDKIDAISPNFLLTGLGIITDKIHRIDELTSAKAPAPHTQVNIQINGESKDKDAVIRELFGKSGFAPKPASSTNVEDVQGSSSAVVPDTSPDPAPIDVVATVTGQPRPPPPLETGPNSAK